MLLGVFLSPFMPRRFISLFLFFLFFLSPFPPITRIESSDANGPVLFWIGSVFQYSNLEPVRSFDWPNLDWFWSFGANRFTSKTRSEGSTEP